MNWSKTVPLQLDQGEHHGGGDLRAGQEDGPDQRAARPRLPRHRHLLRLLQDVLHAPRHRRPLPPLREHLQVGSPIQCD